MLDPAVYRDLVARALAEDVGAGDITTEATVPAATPARGEFLAKADCVVAGLDVAAETFRQVDSTVRFSARVSDGDRCASGLVIASAVGPARALLIGERTALNLLQRLSGIATLTRQFVDAAGGRIAILDTRKTTPTLRALEKYAVRCGGGRNHRAGLYDAFLIKDNHIRLSGGIAAAIAAARASRPGVPVEVEAESLEQIDEGIAAGADIILADNMTTPQLHDVVARVRGRARIEISGRVTLARIPELAATGADFVSIGALTHSAPAVDISFEIEPL